MHEGMVLRIGAMLLGYPDKARLEAALTAVREIGDAPEPLVRFLEAASMLQETDLEQQYVATFDFREDLSLYLTFQELGDARDRAPALLALKEHLRRCGYECPDEELPDYLPLLLEFLAERWPSREDPLERRIAHALHGIAGRMDAGSTYLPLVQAIQQALPAPAEGSGANPPRGEEEDRALPYPLRYL